MIVNDQHRIVKRTLLIILWLMLVIPQGYSQCYPLHPAPYTRISNEPEYWLGANCDISFQEDGQIQIVVDTAKAIYDIDFSKRLEAQGLEYYTIDTADLQSAFIRNLTTKQVFPLGTGIDFRGICLDSCVVSILSLPNRKAEVTVFEYKDMSVTTYNLLVDDYLGYCDSCVFLAPAEFKFGRKKFRYGTIIALNEKGIRIIEPVYKKWQGPDYTCSFYSNSFLVHQLFLYSEQGECYRTDYNSIKITYNENLVDSFVSVGSRYSFPTVHVSDDTLICISTDGSFRKYFQSGKLGEWRKDSWVEDQPLLGQGSSGYFNNGNLLFVKKKFYSRYSEGWNYQNGVPTTLNGIPLKPESTEYTVVIAFDISKNEFLGYPSIIFGKE